MARSWDDFDKLRKLLGKMGAEGTSKADFSNLRRDALAAAHRLALTAAAGEKYRARKKKRHAYDRPTEASEEKARAEAAARLKPERDHGP